MTDGPVPARYNDGRTAATRTVSVQRYGAELAIHADDGSPLEIWSVADVRLVEGPDKTGRIVLCRVGAPARLRIDDAAFAAGVRGWAPNLRRDPYATGVSTKVVVLSVIGAVASFAILIRFLLPLFAVQAARLLPAEWEARSGRWIADAVTEIFAGGEKNACSSPAGTAAFAQLAAPLERAAQLRVPMTLRVVPVPVVNAITLPGSQIVFFRQLIAQANNPNEVAGVLAHEIAHAELRHPTEIAIKVTATSFLIGLLFGDVFGGSAAALATQQLIGSSYTREAEAAADARALELMAAAGYDARPLADFFDRIARNEGRAGTTPSWFASHPASGDRAQRVRALGRPGAPALPPAQWLALKAICGPEK